MTLEDEETKKILERARENLVDAQLGASLEQAYVKFVQYRKIQADRRLEEVAVELRRLEEKGKEKDA